MKKTKRKVLRKPQDPTARILENVTLGDRIRQLRLKKKLNRARAAMKCGMDQSNYAKIEDGLKSARMSTIARILKALGADWKIVETADGQTIKPL